MSPKPVNTLLVIIFCLIKKVEVVQLSNLFISRAKALSRSVSHLGRIVAQTKAAPVSVSGEGKSKQHDYFQQIGMIPNDTAEEGLTHFQRCQVNDNISPTKLYLLYDIVLYKQIIDRFLVLL